MQPLQCGSQHQLASLHLSTHRTTPEHQMTRVMQPFQCDLQAQIPKHPIPAHTQAHPKQLEATVTMRQKKRQTDPAAATAAQTRYLSSSPAATLHGKTQGFVLRLPPQNIAHATSCSHYNAVRSINSQTCTYLRTEQHQNTRTPDDKSHAAIPMRSASTDSKHPITTHTQAHPKQLEATVTMRQKKRQTDPSRNRRTDEVPFIVGCSHITRKNARFRAPASSPKHSPCNIHATSIIRFAASRSKPAPIYARGNIR